MYVVWYGHVFLLRHVERKENVRHRKDCRARIPPGVATIIFNILQFVIVYGLAAPSGTLSRLPY